MIHCMTACAHGSRRVSSLGLTACSSSFFPSSLLRLSRTTCGGRQYPRSDTWWRRLATCSEETLPLLASPGHSRTAPGGAWTACLPQEASWLQMEKSVHASLCVGSAVFKTCLSVLFSWHWGDCAPPRGSTRGASVGSGPTQESAGLWFWCHRPTGSPPRSGL